jgi:hypothetical protein
MGLPVVIDESTLALMATIASTSAMSGWWVARTIRQVENNITSKLTTHETEDQRIFQEHGLRLQRVELRSFGFTGAGAEAVNSPLQEPLRK